MALFTKRYHQPGTTPGTLVQNRCEAPLRIVRVEYTDQGFEERGMASPSDCPAPEICRD